ncbi:MAG: PorT family protein [Bacteroidales bacterium]|jgi:hypothetical protein|nr:PorT family protein [Bacteroidales bacterium]MDN5350976.1 hypothetical protein [Bacteroidales bacterium]
MLKKLFWLSISLFIFILLFSTKGHSQIIKGQLIAGLNLTQVDGDEVYGFKKPGLQLGLGAMIPFGDKWDLSIETLYNEKGAKQKAQYPIQADSTTGAYELFLNYLEVPVLVHFTDKDFITIGAGFSWGRLITAREYEHGRQTNTDAQNGVYNPNDFNVLVDLRMRLYKQVKINFRYAYSMAKIRTRQYSNVTGSTWERKQYNNLLSFRLVYMINEARSEKNRRQTP